MNPQSKILIVEDEADISELMAIHLKRQGFAVDTAVDGKAALLKIKPGEFQLVILDWMIPGLSGLEVLSELRKHTDLKTLPVLMVTAKGQTHDVVKGLESGADDYLTKPFELPEFLARVQALLRRSAFSPTQLRLLERVVVEEVPETTPKSFEGDSGKISVGEIVVDTSAYEAYVQGTKIDLTKSEFKMLVALLTHRGRVMTREKLIELVQGRGINVIDRTVDTHVFGLRKKLGPCGDYIETVRGVGYRVMLDH